MSLMTLVRPSKKAEVAEAPPVVSHKGEMTIAGIFQPVTWDTADPASVNKARASFNVHRRAGYAAQAYGGTAAAHGYSGTMIREFDPEVESINMTLPYAGG